MLNQIQNILNTYNSFTSTLTSSTRIDKIYEIYVISLVLKTLQNLGAQISIRDINNNVTNNLVFRLAPGAIWSPTNNAGFINFLYNGNEYELQNGVRIQGKSKVLHEADISIIEKDEAVNCRQNQIHPRSSKVKLLIECKFYGNNLPLNLGREFLGLSTEFNGRIKTITSNSSSDEIFNLIRSHRGTTNFNISITNKKNNDVFIKWMHKELEHVL